MVEGQCQDSHAKAEPPGILGFAEGGGQGPVEPWSRRGQKALVLRVWPRAPRLPVSGAPFSSVRCGREPPAWLCSASLSG